MDDAASTRRLLGTRGIHNFRDYGGYATPHGRLRAGLLYRSAQHLGATADDLALVAGLRLAAVIDLRGGSEREAAPCPRPEGFAARIYAVSEKTDGLLGPHIEAARNLEGGFDACWLMREGYAAMPYRWRLRNVFANYFEALATTDGPTLVHCAAGKDRTGLACALLHMALGVHRDDVIADYLLTNSSGDAEARVSDGMAEIRRIFGEELDMDQVRLLMLVQPDYLEAALGAIEARHGGVSAYLADHLGVGPGRIEAIASRVIP